MQLFVSEYLCSGAFPGDLANSQLAREGRSMLLAFLEDAARLPNIRVVTTWDKRLGTFPLDDVIAYEVGTNEDEETLFDRLAVESQWTYVIAPETDDILLERRGRVDSLGGTFVGPGIDAIRLCSDKHALAQHLEQHALRTLATELIYQDRFAPAFDFPLVIKPRFGAGCEQTFLVQNAQEFEETCRLLPDEPLSDSQFIQQPYTEGTAVSFAVISSADVQGRKQFTDVLPLCRQQVTRSKMLHYEGGVVPFTSELHSDVLPHLAEQILAAIPGLAGYFGVDLILSNEAPSAPILIEINPRLTTSYLGYRKLTDENLAGRILGIDVAAQGIHWKPGQCSYSPDGQTQITLSPSDSSPAFQGSR